ncbi:hypothetical protein ACFC3A_04450 [Enterococcus thailandicus]|uniref:hypothetical protein n=2 Tax=Enterococcus thailandicus TaxID=417368 RepID=UPI0039A636B4
MEKVFSFTGLSDLKYFNGLEIVPTLSGEGQIMYDDAYKGFKISPSDASNYFRTPVIFLQEGDKLELGFDAASSGLDASHVIGKVEGLTTPSGAVADAILNEKVYNDSLMTIARKRTYLIREAGWYRAAFGKFSGSTMMSEFYLKNCYVRFISNRNLNIIDNFSAIDLSTGVFSAYSNETKPLAKLQWSNGNDLELVLSGAIKPDADIASNSEQAIGFLPQKIIDVMAVNILRDSEVNIAITRRYSKDTRLKIAKNGRVSLHINTENPLVAGDFISLQESIIFN